MSKLSRAKAARVDTEKEYGKASRETSAARRALRRVRETKKR